MGLPQIMIHFRTAGSSAIRRSARGQVVLLAEEEETLSKSFSRWEQAEQAGLSERLARMVRLCFLGNPAKVLVVAYRSGNATAALQSSAGLAEGGWLCAPDMSPQTLAEYVRLKRQEGRALRAVLSDPTGEPDCAGIVNFTTAGIRILLDEQEEAILSGEYCARIAGVLAGISLAQSATFYPLPEVRSFTAAEDAEEEIAAGHLILDQGGTGARLARAVTSLVTLTEGEDSAFQKIKIVEGVDLIRSDIRTVFENDYVGKVLNDYDSKLLLVTAINSYFAGLEGSVLDAGRTNRATVDFDAQKQWLEQHGADTENMSDTAILSANTGSKVFLSASLRFADAMEDLTLEITM